MNTRPPYGRIVGAAFLGCAAFVSSLLMAQTAFVADSHAGQGTTPSENPKSIDPRPASRNSAGNQAPNVATQQPLSLPSLGAIESSIIENKDSRLDTLRRIAHNHVLMAANQQCRPLHRNGDTFLRTMAFLKVTGGRAVLMGVSDVTVTSGAPLSPETNGCLRSLFATPFELLAPAPPQTAPAEQRARYTGKWEGIADIAGDFAVDIGFADKCGLSAEAGAPS